MSTPDKLKKKGLGIATAHTFEEEPSSMVHEQLARLKFAESHLAMKGREVLDFGCGTGYNTFYIAERQAPQRVVGLDILEECIAYCRQHYASTKAEYHVQDCLVHDQRFGLFDIVLSCEVIEHVADQDLFLQVLGKYLAPKGTAVISTPNRELFSLGKERSFANDTHVHELFYDEFNDLLNRHFSFYTIYSQVHSAKWHGPYMNYLSALNLAHALRYEIFGDTMLGKIAGRFGQQLLLSSMFRLKSKQYPNVRNRRYTDFEFKEGRHDRAMWFFALCSQPR